jgi:glycyl-tRNA synthetase beta chain
MTPAGMSAMEKAVEGFTRAANLAKKSETDSSAPTEAIGIDASLFEVTEEKALYAAYQSARKRIDDLTAAHDYVGVLQVVAEISAPVDAFFAAVMVMVDDLSVRNNRLALLRAITGLTAGIVDLSKIVPAAKA